ncbi:MAG: 50S ribosomal protein L24 [Spirochaetales bacterium]|nr:50S ribosomal protein L24 [Spirochaetales bacterium]
MKELVKTKIKKDDTVQIIAGKDKGKTGRVLKVDRVRNRVIIQGLNMVKKAMRRKSQQDKGGIVDIEAPLHTSNVMIICRKCGPTRIKTDFDADKKIRKCRKCGEVL